MVVSILALGLSAFIAVVTYANAFYQPFPGVDPEGLVSVFTTEDDEPHEALSYLDFLDYAAAASAGTTSATGTSATGTSATGTSATGTSATGTSATGTSECHAFMGLAAASSRYYATVRLEAMTEIVPLEVVSGEYFSVLGVPMAIGRGLVPDDDRPGADFAAVISHEWWQRRFGGDASILGRTIYLSSQPHTVIGVAAQEFLGSVADHHPSVWTLYTPFKARYARWKTLSEDRNRPLVRVYARLCDGVRQEQGLAALKVTASGLDGTYPSPNGPRRPRLGSRGPGSISGFDARSKPPSA